MKLKRFAAILTMAFISICSAGNKSICVNGLVFFTINDPGNSVVNIKLLDALSQVLYEYSLEPELCPGTVTKSVLIDFSSNPVVIKDVSFDEFGKVISAETETRTRKRLDEEENLPLNVVITYAHQSGETYISDVNQCSSEISDENTSFLHTFSRVRNAFLIETSHWSGKAGIDEDEAREHGRQEIDQLMQISGYRKNPLGVYVHINETDASY